MLCEVIDVGLKHRQQNKHSGHLGEEEEISLVYIYQNSPV